MTIRPATRDDGTRVIEMALRFLEETPYGVTLSGATPSSLAAVFEAVLELGVIFVAESCCGRLDGFLAIAALRHPLTGRLYADEIAWWVEPEARRGTVGARLLAEAEAWARARQLGLVKMAAPAGSHVGRFYERMGYQAVETAYQKTLSPAS